MLIVTGTHCVSGRTGLTDPALLHYEFYREDCRSVGVKPRVEDDLQPLTKREKKSYDEVEPRQEMDLQHLSKKLKKMDLHPPDSLYGDEDMKDMDIRLANMAYYQGKGKQLLHDIVKVCVYVEKKREIRFCKDNYDVSVQSRHNLAGVLPQY